MSNADITVPQGLWDVDPVSEAYVLMTVQQLHHLKDGATPPFKGPMFSLYGHPFRRVHLLGFIVDFPQKGAFRGEVFGLDDGTGLVRCKVDWWKVTPQTKQDVVLGNLVHVYGVLTVFHETLEIGVNILAPEQDDNEQSYFLERLVHLHQKVYAPALDFSSNEALVQAIESAAPGHSPESKCAGFLLRLLQRQAQEEQRLLFAVSDVMKVIDHADFIREVLVPSAADPQYGCVSPELLVERACSLLVESGDLAKITFSEGAAFQLFDPRSFLADTVLDAIRLKSASGVSATVPFLSAQARSLPTFRLVQDRHIQEALQFLLSQSLIYEAGGGYKTI